MRALMAYPWPGNVRQLENAIERAVAFGGGRGQIEVQDLPPEVRERRSRFDHAGVFLPDEGLDLDTLIAGIERDLIQRSLERTDGNKGHAAKLLQPEAHDARREDQAAPSVERTGASLGATRSAARKTRTCGEVSAVYGGPTTSPPRISAPPVRFSRDQDGPAHRVAPTESPVRCTRNPDRWSARAFAATLGRRAPRRRRQPGNGPAGVSSAPGSGRSGLRCVRRQIAEEPFPAARQRIRRRRGRSGLTFGG